MSSRRSSKGWGRRPRSAIVRRVSPSGWPGDSMPRSCSLSRSIAGWRALTELTRSGVRSSATVRC
eukprot:11843729-Alexandrium_andersonii.AAC.1